MNAGDERSLLVIKVSLAAIFGALAILFTRVFVPLPFGNPNLGSTPVTLAAVFCPLSVGMLTGIIKGIGASIWTGQAFIEMPAGIGDAMMAAFIYSLKRSRIVKQSKLPDNVKLAICATLGQLSRYIFTSGMIALYIGLAASYGFDEAAKEKFLQIAAKYSGLMGMTLHPVLLNIVVVWLAIFVAVTISIIVNAIISCAIIVSAGRSIKRMLSQFGIE
ncbi:MAG: hypothetical protein ACTSXJ_05135 [Candidatus Baldrarchaeia archaeon]